MACDGRLRHTEIVDPAVDRVQRLDDGLLAQVPLDVLLHREVVRTADTRAALVVGRRLLVRQAAELGVFVLRYAFHTERQRRLHRDRTDVDVRIPQRLAQLFARRRRRDPKRVVGVHAEDEVHAALQIQSQFQLFRLHPAGRRQAIALCQDRVDPDPEKDDEHGQNRDDFPAKVLVHDLRIS